MSHAARPAGSSAPGESSQRRPAHLRPGASRHNPHHDDWADQLTSVATSVWLWTALYVVSRAVLLKLWYQNSQYIAGDVKYYRWSTDPTQSVQQVLREYPLPVVWILKALRGFAPDTENAYLFAFGMLMALLDAALFAAFWRSGKPLSAIMWGTFTFALGPIIWFRYDMVPAFVVGLAVLWCQRHPRVAGALVAVGAGLKLWPALLIAPLSGTTRPALRRLAAFGITGVLLAVLALVAGGPRRLVSPLQWQSERGLQIESVPATVAMARHAAGAPYKVDMSPFNAYEITGPGVAVALAVASMLMALAVVNAGALAAVVVLRRRNLPADWLGLAVVAIVATMLVANKTFSPQYMVWFGAAVAAWLALRKRPTDWFGWGVAALTVFLAANTQYVYPANYGGVISGEPDATYALVVRNVLMVAIMAATIVETWREVLTAPRLRHATLPAGT